MLSIPIASRGGVGSGFIDIEKSERGVAIRFGAGSWPENARGLNRLGFIEESIAESRPGQLSECFYFAFMTTSAEKNTEQALRAVDAAGPVIPYVAAEGEGRNGTFVTKVSRVELPSRITWRDYPGVSERVREAIASASDARRSEKALGTGEGAPATFLYAVRRAMLDAKPKTSGALIYNGKEFLLHTDKEPDSARGAGVMRLSATIHDCASGVNTPFKVWYEAGSEHLPPLRFEYQAKPFLRLTFDCVPEGKTLEIKSGGSGRREDA